MKILTISKLNFKSAVLLLLFFIFYSFSLSAADYALTVNSGSGDGTYTEGTTAEITANPPAAAQHFTYWSTSDGGSFADVDFPLTTYTMPANIATVTANYSYFSALIPKDGSKITADDQSAGDQFGYSVAISENSLIVGKTESNTGSVYVFNKSASGWSQEQKLTPSDPAGDNYFGWATDISGDTAVVGAKGYYYLSGCVYVFTRSGGVWTQQAKLTASDAAVGDQFGASVSISGNTIIAGSTGSGSSGAAYVFTGSGSSWSQEAKIIASDGEDGDSFGCSVSVSGNTVVVGADADDDGGISSGSAYVFQRSGTVWSQQQKLTASDAAASDSFGSAVAISGDSVVVGARYNDDSGESSGSAYVFRRNGALWSQEAKLVASDAAEDDQFGQSVAISNDTLISGAIGSGGSGSAYLFLRNGTTWSQQKKITAPDSAANDQFGFSAAVSGFEAVLGANQHSGGGVVYPYVLQTAYSLRVTGGSGDGAFLGGDIVSITADTPQTGYYFVNWTTNDGGSFGVDTDPSTTYTMPSNDAEVTANYAIYTYTLTYTAGANGSITGTSPQTVDYGSDGSEVTAVPDTGYHFVDWSDGVTSASRTDIGITGDLSVTANFAINTYNLIYLADYTAGSISGTPSQTVDFGGDGTEVTAVPNPGYSFSGWDDGLTTAVRTDRNVTSDITVTANFIINPASKLTVENGAGSGLFPEGYVTGIVAEKRPAGEVFDTWILTAGSGVIDDPGAQSTTFTMSGDDATVTATYKIGYILTVNNGSGGGGYSSGTTVSVSANPPSAGMLFDKWTGDTANLADVDLPSTTIIMPSAPTEITATYKVDPLTSLSVTAGSLLTINAAKISGADTEFTSKVSLYAAAEDTLTGKTINASLKAVSKVSSTQQSDLFNAEWTRYILLYDKKELSAENKLGTATSTWLASHPLTPLQMTLRSKFKTISKESIDEIYRGILLVPPSVSSVNRWDEQTPVTDFHAGSKILIEGSFFGSKLPTVSLEYDKLNSPAKKLKKLKVLKIMEYSDARGRVKKSCMNVDSTSSDYGKSRIYALLPDSWEPGTYDLILENKIGIDTFSITIVDSTTNTPPLATGDSYTLQTGDSSYLLDVLKNDQDADSDNVKIVLNSPDSANGGKLSVSKGKIKYTPPKDITAPFSDSFTYSLDDGHGGQSSDTNVDIIFPAMRISSVENWNGTRLDKVQNGGIIILKGHNFGIKAPLVTLNYSEDGVVKTITLKVDRFAEYADYRGNPNKSFTNLLTGASEIKVEMPGAWWSGWSAGTYSLNLDNKIASEMTDIETTDTSTDPLAQDDIETIFSGEKYYTIDVLKNDSDAESANVQIVLPERTSAYGSRIMVDKKTNTIKYFRAKEILCNYANDFFTYYLKEKDGTISNTATVTVSGSLNP